MLGTGGSHFLGLHQRLLEQRLLQPWAEPTLRLVAQLQASQNKCKLLKRLNILDLLTVAPNYIFLLMTVWTACIGENSELHAKDAKDDESLRSPGSSDIGLTLKRCCQKPSLLFFICVHFLHFLHLA